MTKLVQASLAVAFATFATGAIAGCGTDLVPRADTLPNLEVPPAPAPGEGWQVITPIYKDLAPATDVEMCTWTDVISDKQVDVASTLGYQTEPPGHHAIVFYTMEHQPPQTRVCNDSDMATFRFLAAPGSNGELNAAPQGLVYRMPAGAQIVIQHHYLNATDQPLSGQSVVNVNFAAPGNYTPSGNVAFLDSSIDVAPGDVTHDIHCVMQRTMKLWFFIPHMHQWGKHINIDLTQGETKTRMFNQDWDPSYAFHPPEMRVDPSTPVTLNAGDQVDVHCEWNNDTNRSLPFGFEMCVAFGQFVDDQGLGNTQCDAGGWGTF